MRKKKEKHIITVVIGVAENDKTNPYTGLLVGQDLNSDNQFLRNFPTIDRLAAYLQGAQESCIISKGKFVVRNTNMLEEEFNKILEILQTESSA